MEFIDTIFGDTIDTFKEMIFSVNRFMIESVISFVFLIVYTTSFIIFGLISIYDNLRMRSLDD